MVVGLLLSLLSGCGEAGCEPGASGDACRRDQLLELPATDVEAVAAAAAEITDPVLRGHALFAWIELQDGRLDASMGEALCAPLDGRLQHLCERRVAAAHLNR